MRVVILGRGRTGGALAKALEGEPWTVLNLAGSSTEVADAGIVVLAVPDAAIRECATRITPSLAPGTVVLHCAGARGVDPLAPCKQAGFDVGVLHPLVSFADRTRPPSLKNRTFVCQGSVRAMSAARAMTAKMEARLVQANVHGPLYHAAAAMVANGSAAVAWCAIGILDRLGVKTYDARLAIAGLLASVAENIEAVGLPKALTGPIVRGDIERVKEHREILAAANPAARLAYDGLGAITVACARAAGLEDATATELERIFDADSSSLSR